MIRPAVVAVRSTCVAIAFSIFALFGCGDSGGGGAAPVAADPFAAVALVSQTAMSNGLALRVDGARVVMSAGSCARNGGSELLVAQVAPGGAGPSAAETYAAGGALFLSGADAGFVAYTTVACPGTAPPSVSWVADITRAAGSTGSVFKFPSAAAQIETYSIQTANGWGAWTGNHTGLGPQILVGDLVSSPRPPPIQIGSVDVGTRARLSAYGVFWHKASENRLYWVPAPFAMPATPQSIADTSGFATFEALAVDGASVYWKADGDLYVFDAERSIAMGANPRNFGPAEEIVQDGSRVVWTDSGQVYTADIADPLSIPQWISDGAFESHGPGIASNWIVWTRCSVGMASAAGCLDGTATQSLYVFDSAMPYSIGVNPISIRGGLVGSFPFSVGAIGIAWVEAGDPDTIHYFNPEALQVTGKNPVQISNKHALVENLVVMEEGIVWLGGQSGGNGVVEFVPAETLKQQTGP